MLTVQRHESFIARFEDHLSATHAVIEQLKRRVISLKGALARSKKKESKERNQEALDKARELLDDAESQARFFANLIDGRTELPDDAYFEGERYEIAFNDYILDLQREDVMQAEAWLVGYEEYAEIPDVDVAGWASRKLAERAVDKDRTVRELRAELVSSEARLKESEAKLKRVRKDLQEHKRRIKKLHETSGATTVSILRGNLKEADDLRRSQAASYEATVEDLERKLKNAKKEFETKARMLRRKADEAEQKFKTENRKVARQIGQIASLNQSLEVAEGLRDKVKRLEAQAERNKDLEEQLRKANRCIALQQARLGTRTANPVGIPRDEEDVLVENQWLVGEREGLVAEVARLSAENKRLRAENDRLDEHVTNLRLHGGRIDRRP